jgi:hypothetical protein
VSIPNDLWRDRRIVAEAREGLLRLRQKLIAECQVDRARRFANLARSAGEGVENLA